MDLFIKVDFLSHDPLMDKQDNAGHMEFSCLNSKNKKQKKKKHCMCFVQTCTCIIYVNSAFMFFPSVHKQK